MRPAFIAPRGTLAKKPKHGEPCNSCGLCCVATLCPLGRRLFGRALGPCPALRINDDGKSACGVVEEPQAYAIAVVLDHGKEKASAAALTLIGAATGCDARFNGEPPDEAFYGKLRQWDRDNARAIREARKVWRIS